MKIGSRKVKIESCPLIKQHTSPAVCIFSPFLSRGFTGFQVFPATEKCVNGVREKKPFAL